MLHSPQDTRLQIVDNSQCEVLLARIDQIESHDPFSLVTLDVSVAAWQACSVVLSRIRSASLPALVKLHRNDWICETGEVAFLLKALREWDQLTVHNCLALLGDYLPKGSVAALESESKVEMKSFQEWVVAANDPRIHKYPILPWRSFIRKVVAENYEFASGVLDLVYLYGEGCEASVDLVKLIESFLNSKKKVLCLFPKRWGRSQ